MTTAPRRRLRRRHHTVPPLTTARGHGILAAIMETHLIAMLAAHRADAEQRQAANTPPWWEMPASLVRTLLATATAAAAAGDPVRLACIWWCMGLDALAMMAIQDRPAPWAEKLAPDDPINAALIATGAVIRPNLRWDGLTLSETTAATGLSEKSLRVYLSTSGQGVLRAHSGRGIDGTPRISPTAITTAMRPLGRPRQADPSPGTEGRRAYRERTRSLGNYAPDVATQPTGVLTWDDPQAMLRTIGGVLHASMVGERPITISDITTTSLRYTAGTPCPATPPMQVSSGTIDADGSYGTQVQGSDLDLPSARLLLGRLRARATVPTLIAIFDAYGQVMDVTLAEPRIAADELPAAPSDNS